MLHNNDGIMSFPQHFATQNNVANFDFQNVDASFLLQLQFIGTPAIVKIISHFNQTMPTLALDLKSSSMSSYLGLVERPLDQRGILKPQLPKRVKTKKKFTGAKIGAIFCEITSRITTKKFENRATSPF